MIISAGVQGSSPLTRGKRERLRGGFRGGRLIPAHAGKTRYRPRHRPPGPAHPRSRGENTHPHLGVVGGRGSSPLTRGKRSGNGCNGRRRGLIPAHAGKTPPARQARRVLPAHPRSRGENPRRRATTCRPCGSSPLTRGKPDPAHHDPAHSGLIPAHAGKTHTGGVTWRNGGAHPRSRGENQERGFVAGLRAGSSPLTRGKHERPERGRDARRLIPAHAGKTVELIDLEAGDLAHPRSRGENALADQLIEIRRGSSPLTRGKPRPPTPLSPLRRLIPAHAGKTISHERIALSGAAHPRSRGENSLQGLHLLTWYGSSPLTRGKPRYRVDRRRPERLIPAHAGKTTAHLPGHS